MERGRTLRENYFGLAFLKGRTGITVEFIQVDGGGGSEKEKTARSEGKRR